MPRQYKRKTTLDPVKEQRLRDVIQGVKDGTYTAYSASKVFKLSKTTLLRHLKPKSDSTNDSDIGKKLCVKTSRKSI